MEETLQRRPVRGHGLLKHRKTSENKFLHNCMTQGWFGQVPYNNQDSWWRLTLSLRHSLQWKDFEAIQLLKYNFFSSKKCLLFQTLRRCFIYVRLWLYAFMLNLPKVKTSKRISELRVWISMNKVYFAEKWKYVIFQNYKIEKNATWKNYFP